MDQSLLEARRRKKRWYKMMLPQQKEKLQELRKMHDGQDEEEDAIREKMQQDREEKFREQDERLAALMAQFQISKAKEVSETAAASRSPPA